MTRTAERILQDIEGRFLKVQRLEVMRSGESQSPNFHLLISDFLSAYVCTFKTKEDLQFNHMKKIRNSLIINAHHDGLVL